MSDNLRPQDVIARIAKVNLKDTSKILRSLMIYSRWADDDSLRSILRSGTDMQSDLVSTFHFRPSEENISACYAAFEDLTEQLKERSHFEVVDDVRNVNYKTYYFAVNGQQGHALADGTTLPGVVGVIAGSVGESEEFLHLLAGGEPVEFVWLTNFKKAS